MNQELFKEFLKKRQQERESNGIAVNCGEAETQLATVSNSYDEEETQSQVLPEPRFTLGKKRGRPVKKGDKEWQDEEVDILIELWAKHECLFNSKHQLYMNKDARAKAVDRIIESLKTDNIEATAKQIQDKLTKLRNYYGAERRKEESSKVSGSGTDFIYNSPWRFYASLGFLKDTLTPRTTVSNIEEENEEDSVYQINNPPSAKSARKIREKSRENAECVMAKASKALESITAKYQNTPPESQNKKGEDGLFVGMVYEMLSSIPDCMQKAMVKIEFQQKLIQLKYSTAASASTNANYFPMQPHQGFSNTFPQQGTVTPRSSGSSTSTPLSSPVYPSF